jgi:hypothetical protein
MLESIAAQIREAARSQLLHEAEQVGEAARSRAPGSLASHITVELEQDDESHWTAIVFSADPHGRSSDQKAKDPARYNVPAFNEFGTVNMAARPYMRPALEGRRQAIVEGVGEAVSKAAKKARAVRIRGKIRLILKAGGV